MIKRPPDAGSFQFVGLATLRAAQFMRGCRPRVDGLHKATVIAQLEVSAEIVVWASALLFVALAGDLRRRSKMRMCPCPRTARLPE